MVWMESITTMSGGVSPSTLVTMSRTSMAAASSTGALARPRRAARMRICSRPSSPEM